MRRLTWWVGAIVAALCLAGLLRTGVDQHLAARWRWPEHRARTVQRLRSRERRSAVVAGAIRVDRERFEQEGYLLIEDVFDPAADLDPVVDEYAAQLDGLAADWSDRGLIESSYADLPFSERFAQVLNDMGPDGYRPFDITLSGPIAEDSPMHPARPSST